MLNKPGNRRSPESTPKISVDRTKPEPGQFAGWISKKWDIAWVVSRYRKDKRTGALPPERPIDLVYILQYSERQAGGHRSFAKLQGIAAKDHIEAAQKAHAFMESINLAQNQRAEASLFYNERKIELWIGQNENDANEK